MENTELNVRCGDDCLLNGFLTSEPISAEMLSYARSHGLSADRHSKMFPFLVRQCDLGKTFSLILKRYGICDICDNVDICEI